MSNLTHMGQPASQHVLLECINVANTGDPRQDLDFFRTLPDGSVDPQESTGFRVPNGQMLVITDVDWQYASGTPGGTQTFRIFIDSSGKRPVGRRVFESTVLLNGNGEAGISESMTTGFVLAPHMRISVDTVTGGGKIQHVLLRGYLVQDK